MLIRPDAMCRSAALAAVVIAIAVPQLDAQRIPAAPASPVSVPVSDIRYEVTFDRAHGAQRSLGVAATFALSGRDPLIVSLPAWTPGAYELSNFARNVSAFTATGDGKALTWDLVDYDTWRIQPNGAKSVTVSFAYKADSLDNAMAWSKDDFAFFNGTNVFLYPEGRSQDFQSTVTIKTESGWKVATGMAPAGAPLRYTAKNYHDLVDMPFFVGAFDYDSAQVSDRWVRLATYPAGALAGQARNTLWDQHRRMIPPMNDVFKDVPYDSYTSLLVFDSTYQGGSALEHQNSHVGIYTPFIIGNTALPSITAHEIFHVWNVKRMRPSDMVPYRYDRAQPTPWLWVSEGITDYYADLALVRGKIVDSTGFLRLTNGKMQNVDALPPVALEDASLATWIHPTDGTAYIYYDKGSLAGLLLDIYIRDASDNAKSLDDVMREVYQTTYSKGRGFGAADWWGAVTRAAGGKSFDDFNKRYIDGREPFPYRAALPLAGMRVREDTIRTPQLGVFTGADSSGVKVTQLDDAGAASAAGVQVGDVLLQVGEIPAEDAAFGARFRSRYARAEGAKIPIKVRRGTETLTLELTVQTASHVERQLVFDPGASAKAVRVRTGILTGTSGGLRPPGSRVEGRAASPPGSRVEGRGSRVTTGGK